MLLEELGFIKYVKVGAKEIAIILLINPYLVIANLRRDGNLSDDCWYAILERMKSIGAESPEINAILNA